MKIYTRTGDAGMTSLVGGSRISKTAPRLEAYGTIDELNSHLGFLVSLLPPSSNDAPFLQSIQSRLFDLGAYLATPPKTDPTENSGTDVGHQPSLPVGITDTEIATLETEIDRLTPQLPPLNSFILPAGCKSACQAHICRTICRRAERHTLAITPLPHPLAIAYLNRLSDYLFTLARYLNHLTSTPEIPWLPA